MAIFVYRIEGLFIKSWHSCVLHCVRGVVDLVTYFESARPFHESHLVGVTNDGHNYEPIGTLCFSKLETSNYLCCLWYDGFLL